MEQLKVQTSTPSNNLKLSELWKVTDCAVTLHAWSVSRHVQSGIWDNPDTCYRQACLINPQAVESNREAIK